MRTSHVVYLALLGFVAWRVSRLPETVSASVERWSHVAFRPRLGVPRAVRRKFVAPAVAAFAVFALGGYYAALIPALLAQNLGIASPAIAGAVVAELYAVASVVGWS